MKYGLVEGEEGVGRGWDGRADGEGGRMKVGSMGRGDDEGGKGKDGQWGGGGSPYFHSSYPSPFGPRTSFLLSWSALILRSAQINRARHVAPGSCRCRIAILAS